MEPFTKYLPDYKKQLEKGTIQKAYRGLMEYIMSLRNYLQAQYPDYLVSGSIYYGYMDMTYFSFFPPSLKGRGLKAGVVFLHEAFRFEAWLYGYNKQVQARYWKLFKDSGWDKYRLIPTLKGQDSILEYSLVENPDFRDLEALTGQIEGGTIKFIQDITLFLDEHPMPDTAEGVIHG